MCLFVFVDEVKSTGRLFKKSDDPVENLQNVIDDQADDIKDLKETIDSQNNMIEDLKTQINKLSDVLNEISVEDDNNRESGLRCERKIEMLLKENDRNFEKFSENDAKFGQELLQQKVNLCINIYFCCLNRLISTKFRRSLFVFKSMYLT